MQIKSLGSTSLDCDIDLPLSFTIHHNKVVMFPNDLLIKMVESLHTISNHFYILKSLQINSIHHLFHHNSLDTILFVPVMFSAIQQWTVNSCIMSSYKRAGSSAQVPAPLWDAYVYAPDKRKDRYFKCTLGSYCECVYTYFKYCHHCQYEMSFNIT